MLNIENAYYLFIYNIVSHTISNVDTYVNMTIRILRIS